MTLISIFIAAEGDRRTFLKYLGLCARKGREGGEERGYVSWKQNTGKDM